MRASVRKKRAVGLSADASSLGVPEHGGGGLLPTIQYLRTSFDIINPRRSPEPWKMAEDVKNPIVTLSYSDLAVQRQSLGADQVSCSRFLSIMILSAFLNPFGPFHRSDLARLYGGIYETRELKINRYLCAEGIDARLLSIFPLSSYIALLSCVGHGYIRMIIYRSIELDKTGCSSRGNVTVMRTCIVSRRFSLSLHIRTSSRASSLTAFVSKPRVYTDCRSYEASMIIFCSPLSPPVT